VGGTLNQYQPTVLIEDLFYTYPPLAPGDAPTDALSGVSLSVQPGEFVAILGPSGAGKTTLCLSLCGIVPHSTGGTFGGRVLVCGEDTRRSSPAALSAKVGVVFQDPESQLFTTIVEDEVAFGLESQGLHPREIDERVTWALAQVHMSEHRLRNPAYLSGGQKQRIAIAAAIAVLPQLLVLDEPTASLDPVGCQEVTQTLAELRRQLDSSVVMVTHDTELAAEFADRVVVLAAGRVAYDGSPEELLQEPELLRRYGVQPPALAELSSWLTEHGLPMRFYSLPGAESQLRARLEERLSCRLS